MTLNIRNKYLKILRKLFFYNRFLNNGEYNLKKFVKYISSKIPSGESVLDAGAGECQYKKYFEHTNYVSQDLGIGDNAWDYSQLDIKSEIYSIPVADNSFDHILCIEVLEHLKYPHKAFMEFSRILKPGGTLYVVCPLTWEEHQKPYDYFRYTQFGLQALGNDVGFKITTIRKHGGKYILLSNLINGFIPGLFFDIELNLIGYILKVILYPVNLLTGFIFYILNIMDRKKNFVTQYEVIYVKQ